MVEIYHAILYQPILNLLVFLYNVIPGHDIGLAILAMTIIIKLILLPFGSQALKSQKALQDIQPKIDALKEKYKDDKEKLAKETMNIYKEQKVNPLSSCLPMLIQIPFLIAVYQAFRTGLATETLVLYPFIANPGHIDAQAFGIVNVPNPNLILAVLAGLAQFVQTMMLSTKKPQTDAKASKDENVLASMNKSMLYFMPLMTIFISMSLPSGLAFYWFVTTLLTIVQQKIIFSKNKIGSAVEIKQ